MLKEVLPCLYEHLHFFQAKSTFDGFSRIGLSTPLYSDSKYVSCLVPFWKISVPRNIIRNIVKESL